MQEITDKNKWNSLVLTGTHHSFLQSWEWGEFQAKYGKVFRYAEGEAFATVLEKTLPLDFTCWFMPKGARGIGDKQREAIATDARKAGAIFLRFEPEQEPTQGVRITAVNPSVTLVTDLMQTEEQLLAAMHQKTRYNIRLAQKKGVVISESKDADVWNALMDQTAKRDGFRAHPARYYRDMLECGIVKLFVAELDGKPLAAMIATFFGDTATYLHGASSNEARETMAPYALHFEVMKFAKSIGCTRYDWWGMNPSDEGHEAYKKSWEGISRFKRGFGGEEVITPGTFEVPLNTFWYRLYALRRKLLRRG